MQLQMDLHVERLVKIDDRIGGRRASRWRSDAAFAGAGALSLVFGYLARVRRDVAAVRESGAGATRGRSSGCAAATSTDTRLRPLPDGRTDCVNFLSANVDYLLVGRYLGVGALGAYSIAYQLVVKPVFELNPILTRVAFPAFAKKQERQRGSGPWLRRGDPSDRLHHRPDDGRCRGPRAGDRARLSSGEMATRRSSSCRSSRSSGVARGLTSPVGDLVLAKGRPDLNFKLNALVLISMIVTLAVAVQFSVVAVAWASSAVNILDYLIFYFVVTRLIGMRHTHYWRSLRWIVVNAAASAAAMLLVRITLESRIDSGGVIMLATALTGIVAYLGLAGWHERKYIQDILRMLRPVRLVEPTPLS